MHGKEKPLVSSGDNSMVNMHRIKAWKSGHDSSALEEKELGSECLGGIQALTEEPVNSDLTSVKTQCSY
jgi:hypothetical protein